MSTLANNEGLRAFRVCFSYGERQIIDNISFELKPGTLTALVGPNGAGKSTLLHLLQGRLQRDSGHVECNDSITVMPQRTSIDWTFPITVNDMVRLGGRNLNHHPGKHLAKQLLKRVGMEQLAQRRLSDLSGGQQQRVGLCRAMMLRPEILLLDEPFAAIDPITRVDIHRQLIALHKAEPTTAVLVTHDMREAMRLADHIVVMRAGRISCSKSTAQLQQDNPGIDPEDLLQSLISGAGQ